MFNTSEEKLQDQLTKTMSVVFEGIVELGGASAENRRLTYAWRLRQLLSYNAARQRVVSDFLEFLIILFTLFSTCAACFYTFSTTKTICSSDGSSNNSSSDQCPISQIGNDILNKLNLILPLLATVFRGISASLNPLQKWSVLKIGAIRGKSINSIIYYLKILNIYNQPI